MKVIKHHCIRSNFVIASAVKKSASFAKQNLVSTQSVRLIASAAKQSKMCSCLHWIATSPLRAPRNDKKTWHK